jgi:hypothetical protein
MAALKQQPSGLGFYIPSPDSGGMKGISHLSSLLSASRDDPDAGINDYI